MSAEASPATAENPKIPGPLAGSVEAAREAGLRYTSDASPGIRRRRVGKGFTYARADNSPVREAVDLDRIRALAIPPAWTAVWISRYPDGHIQATGRDVRGRKQYRYHADWRVTRDENKFDRLLDFAKILPGIRRRVSRDLALPGLPREKVLATVVRLLETTLIRVGNDEYARQNRSFGLTTLLSRHVRVTGDRVRFRFRGKSGKEHDVDLVDPRLARIVRRCQDLPGQELFQYGDEATTGSVGSADVNEYLRAVIGQDFTAKHFRTWAGTVLAARELRRLEVPRSARGAERNVLRVIDVVAGRLGNTRAVCRRCYVHPAILNAYVRGDLLTVAPRTAAKGARAPALGLRSDEAAVVAILRRAARPSGKRRSQRS